MRSLLELSDVVEVRLGAVIRIFEHRDLRILETLLLHLPLPELRHHLSRRVHHWPVERPLALPVLLARAKVTEFEPARPTLFRRWASADLAQNDKLRHRIALEPEALEFVKKQVLAAVDALGYLYCGVREMRVANRELLDPDNESWLDCSFA